MNNVKIDVNDYSEYGLDDIYYGLLSFISQYVTANYNPLEVFENEKSTYAVAITTMKGALKELLDYFKSNDEIYLPSINKKVKISTLSITEKQAVEEVCKEYMVAKLNDALTNNFENKSSRGAIWLLVRI